MRILALSVVSAAALVVEIVTYFYMFKFALAIEAFALNESHAMFTC